MEVKPWRGEDWLQPAGAVTLTIASLLMTGCGPTLDTTQVQETIRDGVIKQGGISLKAVTCPQGIRQREGKQFECQGQLDSGETFPIFVSQPDDQGSIRWHLPNVPGLLHLPTLQAEIETRLRQRGYAVTVDCGSRTYKATRPGDRFDCKLLPLQGMSVVGTFIARPNTTALVPPTQVPMAQPLLETIAVQIMATGEVAWQRVAPVSRRMRGPTARVERSPGI